MYIGPMRQRKLVALVALLTLGLGLVFVAVVQSRPTGKVYTVTELTAGLAHNPKRWLGRTLLVRGRSVIVLCLYWSCPYEPHLLIDVNAPYEPVPLCPGPQSISLTYTL